MPATPNLFDDAVNLVRNRAHLRVVEYIRENPGAYPVSYTHLTLPTKA